MKHLVVAAHPLKGSVTIKLALAYGEEIRRLGHQPVIHDLYRMGFDPVLTAGELEPLQHQREPPEQVRAEQAAIKAAEVLTVIYPFWWAAMPAILKGYIDRVFARGFAYEANGGINKPLLSGKRCVLITLSGSPLDMLKHNGQWPAIKLLQDEHVFGSFGYDLLEHLHFDLVEPPIPESDLHDYLARVRECARCHFGDSGSP